MERVKEARVIEWLAAADRPRSIGQGDKLAIAPPKQIQDVHLIKVDAIDQRQIARV